MSEKFVKVPGLVEEETMGVLREQIVLQAKDGDLIVECGVFLGSTVCYVGQALKKLGVKAKIYAIDNWLCANISDESKQFVNRSESFLEGFTLNVAKCGLTDMVTTLQMDSLTAVDYFENNSISFLFLDASHNYEDVKDELKAWLPKVKNGGIICGHDFSDPSVNRAVVEVLGNVNESSSKCAYWIENQCLKN